MKLYAGTTRAKADQALMKGLTKPFSLTDDRDFAIWLAEDKSTTGNRPVVLEVDVDPRNLETHDAAWDEPPEAVLDDLKYESLEQWKEDLDRGRVRRPAPKDWEASLKKVHWVMHHGEVTPSNIREVIGLFDPEEEPKGSKRLYIGTERAKGLRAVRVGVNGPLTLKKDPEDAIEVGAQKAPDGDWIILQIDVPEDNLLADMRMWDDPPPWVMTQYGIADLDDWKASVRAGDIVFPTDERDWRRSYDVMESVRHVGRIEPSQIEIWLDPEEETE